MSNGGFRIDVFHHFEPDNEVLSRLDDMSSKLDLVIGTQENIMATLDDVLKDVTDESDRLDSIAALITGLRQQVADALSGVTLPPTVQAKVDAIFTQAETNKGKIDAALNTGVPPPAVTPA